MERIDARTRIQTLLQEHPETARVLAKYNLGCTGCLGVKHETVGRGAQAHGVDVNELLRDLNAVIAAPHA